MKHIQKQLTQKKLALAVGLLLSGGSNLALAADEELYQQLDTLKQQMASLQQRLNEVEAQSKSVPQLAAVQTELPEIDADAQQEQLLTEATPATSEDIEAVRAELENYKYDQSRQYERQTAKTARDTTLYGTVQLRANVQDNHHSGSPKSSFDIGTALIGVRGNLYRDYNEGKNLDYQLSYGYSKRNDGSNNSNFNLLDAYLRYHAFSTNAGLETPRLNLTLGQQLLPFGLDVQSPEDLRPTITTASSLNSLGLFTRQNGFIVRGDVKPFVDYAANYRAPLLEYALGVTNGNGSNKADDNDGKEFVARAAFTLPVDYASWLRELKLGLSYINGESKIAAAGIVEDKATRDRFGIDLYYNHAPFGVTYEYVQGYTDFISASTAVVQEAKAEGHTLTVFYTLGDQFYNSIKSNAKFDDFWPKSLQGYYRYDRFNPNTKQNDYLDLSNGRTGEYDIHSLGLNLFFAQTTKFQLQLNHYNFELETAAQKDSNELQAQFQYTF